MTARPGTSVVGPSAAVDLVPQGTRRPETVPDEIFEAALAKIVAGERLDMGRLASELGMSRATLYRRVNDRDELLGEVAWFLVRQGLIPTLDSIRDLEGAERVTQGVLRFLALVRQPNPAFRRLLNEEPAASLRLLASKRGPIQGHLIEVTRRVISEERSRGNLHLGADPELVATAVIRLSESFLYGHLIAGEDLDIDQLGHLIRHVLREGAD